MVKNEASSKTKKDVIELGKEVPTSVISVSREFTLSVNILNPKTVDELYATVPEITRSADLRGAAVISRGFEIIPRDDSQDAKDFASLCLRIINNSGGVSFIEQWHKNTDLYGNGYVELVDDGSKITRLAPVHAFQFGYELEEFVEDGAIKTRIKLDKDTQLPVGFASYKFNQTKNILENDKLFDLERIAHLKYKVIGDALYGISMVQPMFGSVLRKLKIEQAIEDTARLVASPKIVISGEFADDAEARQEAKEAASLDVADVVLLMGEKKFEIVNPGETSLPELRDIFVTNITTTTGIPRPILTSEGNDINKATIQELMKFLREDMRSDINKIKELFENFIFKRIGETWSLSNFESIIPIIQFPENIEQEEEIIVREERKAATITSLSNSLMLMNNMLMGSKSTPANTDKKQELLDTMDILFKTLSETNETFRVNNDQRFALIEEDTIGSDIKNTELTLSAEIGIYNNYSIVDEIDTIQQPDVLLSQHHLVHQAFEQFKHNTIIRDPNTNEDINMVQMIEKHRFYVDKMGKLGVEHPPSEAGKELDQILHQYLM